MPLTASNTAVWTMAATRVTTNGLVPPTSAARNSVWFQSTTSSAYALEPAAIATASARQNVLMTLIASLFSTAWPRLVRDSTGHHARVPPDARETPGGVVLN